MALGGESPPPCTLARGTLIPMALVPCIGCGTALERNTPHPRATCAGCKAATRRRAQARYVANHPRAHGDAHRKHRYGITSEQYDAMAKHGCRACGAQGVQLHVDHDHSCCSGAKSCGRCVRGLLCRPCNNALACVGDDPQRLAALITYLEA